jgi:hypothetical protein
MVLQGLRPYANVVLSSWVNLDFINYVCLSANIAIMTRSPACTVTWTIAIVFRFSSFHDFAIQVPLEYLMKMIETVVRH